MPKLFYFYYIKLIDKWLLYHIMKIILLSIIILSTLLFGESQNNILNLTDQDIKDIKENPKKKEIIKRIKDFKKLKADITKNKDKYSVFKQLSRTNSYFNNILSKHDKISTNTEDHWATRKEFIIKGHGDCEDYAISKYFTLKELDFDANKLYMMVVKVKGSLSYHMVLGYFDTKESIPLILDNLSFKVVSLDKRKDLEVKFVFNEYDAYLMKDNKLHQKTNINWNGNNKWQGLLDRIYKEDK